MDATNGEWRVLEAPAGPGPAAGGSAGAKAAAPAGAAATTAAAGGWFWWAVLALGLLGLVAASGWMLLGSDGGTVGVEARLAAIELEPSGDPLALPVATAAPLVIDVGGAVARPGVYRLPAGSRVADAIEAAGGFGPTIDAAAAARDLNLAATLSDGERVRVPARGETAATDPAGVTPAGAPSNGLVNLNTATAGELEALPAIGAATAAKIIASRDERRFSSVDDLRARKLLGESAFGKVRDLVTVR